MSSTRYTIKEYGTDRPSELICTRHYPRFTFPGTFGFIYSSHVNGLLTTFLQMKLLKMNSKDISTFAYRHMNTNTFTTEVKEVCSYATSVDDELVHSIASVKANTIVNVVLSIMNIRVIPLEEEMKRFIEYVTETYHVCWMKEIATWLQEEYGIDVMSAPLV